MSVLFIISLIWACSFGLTKEVSILDPNYIGFIRLSLSLPIFLPFLRLRGITASNIFHLMFIGAVQYGLFYCLYGLSYKYLLSYQVALFTIFMPIYVTLINDLYRKTFRAFHLANAGIAALGAGIILIRPNLTFDVDLLIGFLLMQGASVCYSYGQIEYKRFIEKNPALEDSKIFALLYAGAVPITGTALFLSGGWTAISNLNARQIYILLYLGLIASGICFYVWNKMTTHVTGGTLAVFNNVKIPLAVIASLTFFHEPIEWFQLLIGGFCITLAAWYSYRYENRTLKVQTQTTL